MSWAPLKDSAQSGAKHRSAVAARSQAPYWDRVTGDITSFSVVDDDSIGIPFCEAWLNSTGVGGELSAFGSATISLNRFRLEAEQLPPGSAALAISSLGQSFVLPAGGAMFRLCLGGSPVSRHLGTLGAADAAGHLTMPISLAEFPMTGQPTGPVLPGQTWHFQVWHRDVPTASNSLSNMTIGVSVAFE